MLCHAGRQQCMCTNESCAIVQLHVWLCLNCRHVPQVGLTPQKQHDLVYAIDNTRSQIALRQHGSVLYSHIIITYSSMIQVQ